MVLMWLYVDSVLISILKSQSSLTETNFRGGRRNELIFYQKYILQAIKYDFTSTVKNSLAFAVHQKYLSC